MTPAFAQQNHCLISEGSSQTLFKEIGVRALSVQIGRKQVIHFVSVVPQHYPPFFVRADLLVRLGAQLDAVNRVLWSQASAEKYPNH